MINRLFIAVTLAVCLVSHGAWAASNFLENPGTNGFIATPYNLLSTELNTLASGACAVSSVGGTSGVFSQTNTASAPWMSIYFTAGGAVTPVTGQLLEGWFLRSPDGGTTFETVTATCSTTVPPLPRAPDFIIPLSAAAYASGNIAWANNGSLVPAPFESNKVELWNTGTAALPASGNLIKAGPVVIQY
jgi:hypothetical protein